MIEIKIRNVKDGKVFIDNEKYDFAIIEIDGKLKLCPKLNTDHKFIHYSLLVGHLVDYTYSVKEVCDNYGDKLGATVNEICGEKEVTFTIPDDPAILSLQFKHFEDIDVNQPPNLYQSGELAPNIKAYLDKTASRLIKA